MSLFSYNFFPTDQAGKAQRYTEKIKALIVKRAARQIKGRVSWWQKEWRLSRTLFLLLFMTLPIKTVSNEKKIAQISVTIKQESQVNAPISVSLKMLPENYLHHSMRLQETTGGQNKPLPFQIEFGDENLLWWILPNRDQTGNKRSFELKLGKAVDSPFIEFNMDETGLEITKGESKILRYNFGLIPPPKSQNPLFTRSGFIHPIWSPGGKVLTRIHPSDHIHHLGFWNPWTKTEFEGRNVDFWNLGNGQGTVRFVRFQEMQSGPVFAAFEAIHEFVDFTAPDGEKVALNEIWEIRVWNSEKKNIRIWDFTTRQNCAGDSPLKILKYRYGGFGFRATADWNDKNSHYLTSEGKSRSEANGTRARWCQIYGQTDAGQAGIVFLSHPQNYSFPEPMRIWPQGDLFFGFCPVVDADWILEPGKEYVRKYRILVYDGELLKDEIEQYWQSFTDPPETKIIWQLN